MNWLTAVDSRLTWHNVAEFFPFEGGFRIQRVPEAWRARFLETTASRCLDSANVYLRFHSTSGGVSVRWRSLQPPPVQPERWGDVFCNGNFLGHFSIKFSQEMSFSSPGGGLWEVHFPWGAKPVFDGLGIEDGCEVRPEPPAQKRRWLAYGDSITQGFTSYTATGTWVWLAAQELELEPINLGFGGSAFGDAAVAEYIASRTDWDMMSAGFGINNVGRGDTVAQVVQFHERFLEIIRKAHPSKPLLWITPIITVPWDIEGQKTASGERVQEFRDAIAEVARRRMKNDPNLHLVDGLSCVSDAKGLEDVVHPNNAGMRQYAARVAAAWRGTRDWS